MKILFVSHIMPCPADDGSRYGFNLSVKSLYFNNECTLVASYNNANELEQTRLQYPNLRLFTHPSIVSNWNRIKGFFALKAPALCSKIDSKMIKTIKTLTANEDFDLIFFYPQHTIYYNKYAKKPCVISVADAVAQTVKDRIKETRGIRKIYDKINQKRIEKVEIKEYEKFDGVFVVSPRDAGILLSNNKNLNVFEVPLAAADEFFLPRLSKNSRIKIGYCYNRANKDNYVGFREFIEKGLPILRKIGSDFEINAIVGKNPPKDIEELCLNDNIVMHKYVVDFAEFMRSMDITLAFDTIGGGLKNRVLQAFAAGNCVIGTPVALQGFDYKEGETAFCGTSVDEIIQKTAQLLNNQSLIQQVGENAREMAKNKYTFEKVSERWNKLINEIVEKHKSKEV